MSTTDRVDAYAKAIFEIAATEGFLSEVADELFRFARTFEGNDALRSALTDPQIPVERRQAVVEELIGAHGLIVSKAVASFIVGIGRVHDLPAIIDRFVELAAEAREHELAEVRSAVPLDDAQVARLAAALSHATGKHVEVKVVIDESVMGGLVARIGDTVIDGTVRTRLEQLKEQI